MKMFQQGTTLLLSLVFLVLLGIAGTAAIRMSSNNLQFNNALIDHQRAFQAAEMGLRLAEERLNQQIALFSEANNCVDGLCFFGTFDPGHSCSHNPEQMQEQLAELSNYHAHQSSGVRLYSQTHFLCFLPRPGLTAANLTPPPSNQWLALYGVTSIGQGANSSSVLRSVFTREIIQLEASLPAIFAVRESVHSISGADVRAFYCGSAPCTAQEISNNQGSTLFDANKTSGISYGSLIHATGDPAWGWQNLEFYVDEHELPDCLARRTNDIQSCQLKSQMPGWARDNMNRASFCGVDGSANCVPESTKITGETESDSFFSQYFGAEKSEIFAKGLTLKPSDMVHANLDNIPDNLLIIDGDLDLHTTALPNNPNLIVVVRGNIIANNPIRLPKLALLYAEQDLFWNSSIDMESILAVEGNASLFASINLRPNSNPLNRLSNLSNPSTRLSNSNRVSWQAL